MPAPVAWTSLQRMLEQLFRGKHMAEVVDALADKFADDHNLAARDRSEQFEIFAAYCVTSQYYADFDPEDLHAGQSRDLSIDAYAIIINDGIYTDIADVERVVEKARQLRVHFILIQAKRSRRFEGNVFTKMIGDIRHIFSNEQLQFPAGPKAVNLRACITAIYEDPGKFSAARAPRLSVWYASLGTFRQSSHRARMEDAAAELRKPRSFKVVDVQAAGAHELRDLYHRAQSMGSATFGFPDRVEMPRMHGVEKAFMGLLPATVLVDKVLTDNGAPRPYLFHDNMRDFLGVNGPVNKEIRDTLLDDNCRDQFAVLNNGITIVTRNMVVVGPQLHIKDPQIVNGCQTCNVLLAERDSLDGSVMVGVRIVESADEDVIDRIIRATNTQNALSRDDLRARDGFQRLLEDYFRSQPADRRVYYERRARQYSGIPKSKIISRRHLTQAYAAMWLDEPHNVTSYQILLEEHQSELFHLNQDPLPYYVCAVGLYQLNLLLGRPGGAGVPPTYRPARFHLLNGMKLRLLGPASLPGREEEARLACGRMLDVLWHPGGAQQLVEGLLPAISAARTVGGELASDARTEEFTNRFRDAVQALPQWTRVAA